MSLQRLLVSSRQKQTTAKDPGRCAKGQALCFLFVFGVLIVYAGQATGGESTKGQALCFLFVFGVLIVYAGQATVENQLRVRRCVFYLCLVYSYVRWSSDGWRIN